MQHFSGETDSKRVAMWATWGTNENPYIELRRDVGTRTPFITSIYTLK
jgi:hypothetical protein